jgi:hypothetical protein
MARYRTLAEWQGLTGDDALTAPERDLIACCQKGKLCQLGDGFHASGEVRLAYAVAPHFLYYGYVRIHQTLKITPVMAASLIYRLWDIADLVTLIDAEEEAPKKCGLYMKKTF